MKDSNSRKTTIIFVHGSEVEQIGYGYAALQKDLPKPFRLESPFIGPLNKVNGAATGSNIAYKLTDNDNEVVADLFLLDWHDQQEKINSATVNRFLAVLKGFRFGLAMLFSKDLKGSQSWPIITAILFGFFLLFAWSFTAFIEVIALFFSIIDLIVPPPTGSTTNASWFASLIGIPDSCQNILKKIIDTLFLGTTLLFSWRPELLVSIDVGHNARSYVEEGAVRREVFKTRLSEALTEAEKLNDAPPIVLAHSAGAMATVIALSELAKTQRCRLVTLGSPVTAMGFASKRVKSAVSDLLKYAATAEVDFQWTDYHAPNDWWCSISAIPNNQRGTEVHEVSDFEHDWQAQSDGRAHRVYFSKLDIWTRIIAKIPLFETKPI